MSKLKYEDKINLYEDKKQGFSTKSLSRKYNITSHGVQYLCCLVDKHGYEILKTKKNKYYSSSVKQEAINRVLINNESIWSVALDMGLPGDGMLHSWISKYKENGYNIVERKRGRPAMQKKPIKIKKNETIEEENERLKKENEYLKAELEYTKKLRAVVQARKNQQQKKK